MANNAQTPGSGVEDGENEMLSMFQLLIPEETLKAENMSVSVCPANAEILAPYSV